MEEHLNLKDIIIANGENYNIFEIILNKIKKLIYKQNEIYRMKYLKTYNESIRDLMTPKSEEEILNSLKNLSNSELLYKSIKYEFIKGIELALQNELTKNHINYIEEQIFYIKNEEIVKLLLNKIKAELSEDQIYIIEKYQLGLHQYKQKTYERWFKTMLTDLDVTRSRKNSDVLIYKKGNVVLYEYNEKKGWFDMDHDKIWSVFKSKYHLNFDEIKLITKNMVKKHLNLKDITTW
jgi:hypothetical protein